MSDVTRLIARAREIMEFSEDAQLIGELARELEKAQPRIIETVEELDALAHESIVLTEQGCYWQADKRGHEEIWWLEPGNPLSSLSEELTLPATAFYTPEVSE